MVVQAEHIPVHLGAMPDAVAAVASLPGRLLDPQRPVHRRHAPAGRHARLAHGRSGTRSRARTTPTSAEWSPRACPRSRASCTRRALIVPPVQLTDEVLELFVANARNPDERRGDLRAQIAAHRLAERRVDELCARRRARARRRGDGRAVRVLGADGARRDRAAPRRTRTAEDVVEAVEGDLRIRGDRRGRRRRDPHRLRRHSAQHAGNLNCPLAVTKLGVLLRRALPHRAGPAGIRAARSRPSRSPRRKAAS